jgi:hypothetical protein
VNVCCLGRLRQSDLISAHHQNDSPISPAKFSPFPHATILSYVISITQSLTRNKVPLTLYVAYNRIPRSALFADDIPSVTAPAGPSILASLENSFPFDITSLTAQPADDPTNNSIIKEDEATTTEFNLFSTAGVKKVDLSAPVYEVPLINRTRPREYYFTSTYPRLGNYLIIVMIRNEWGELMMLW